MRLFRSAIPILSVLLLVVAAAALPTLAQKVHKGHGHDGDGDHGKMAEQHMMARVFDHLDVSKDQREQLEALHAMHAETTKNAGGDLDAAHETLMTTIHAESFDEAAIRAASAEISRIQTDLHLARAEMYQKLRQILTPDQLDKLREHHDLLKSFHDGDRLHSRSGLHPSHHP